MCRGSGEPVAPAFSRPVSSPVGFMKTAISAHCEVYVVEVGGVGWNRLAGLSSSVNGEPVGTLARKNSPRRLPRSRTVKWSPWSVARCEALLDEIHELHAEIQVYVSEQWDLLAQAKAAMAGTPIR